MCLEEKAEIFYLKGPCSALWSMVSESSAALLLLEPNSLLVIMGPFPGVSHCGNSVWPKPNPAAAKQLQGQQLCGACGCPSVLEPSLTGVTLMWHRCDTNVAPMWHWCGFVPEPATDSWTGWGGSWHWSCFFPPSFCYRNKEVWGSVVQPCGSTGIWTA